MTERFAVVVATRNRSDLVATCVERLRSMSGSPDQIVVVDDGSTDDTVARMSATDGVTLVHGDGRGPARARNLGVAASDTEWLVFLDDDDGPDNDWMDGFRALAARHPDASYLSVGHRRDVEGVVTYWPVAGLGAAFSGANASFLAGTFAIRRTLFDQVGGFDDRLRHMEFTDLALRAFEHTAGHPEMLARDPRPRITHIGRPPQLRSSQNPYVLSSSALVVLDKTRHLWELDPMSYANQLSTVGVASLRAGATSRGKRLLRRSMLLRPTVPSISRTVAASVPPLRRRAWPELDPARADGTGAGVAGAHAIASVIIPSYGRQDLMGLAVQSVLAQTEHDVEVIVVDDGSPVPLVALDDPRVRVVRQENAGPAAARNRGAAEATGEFLFFLDDDDVYTPERLENALRAHARTQSDIVVCAQSWINGAGHLDRHLVGFVHGAVLNSITPHLGATSVRRSRFVPFDERFTASQDVEWWLRISEECTVSSIPTADCRIRRHDAQRHLNGPGARLECGYELLDEHADYFATHPHALAFRRARLARAALSVGDAQGALHASIASCRTAVTMAGLTAVVAALRAKLADWTTPAPKAPGIYRSPISPLHARSWRTGTFGPPEARMIAASRPARIAGEVAAHLPEPWAGHVRTTGARLGRKPLLEIRTAFGVFLALRHDHTLQHPSYFEGFESALVARLIDPGMTVVDIGADRGWYTAMAAHLVGERGHVIAVESDDRMRAALQRTVDHNAWRDRVVVDRRAISDATDEDLLSQLVGDATPDFVRIDVEGAAFRVVEGCRFERFGDDLPTILFGFQPELIERAGDKPRDLLDLLWNAGYALYQLQPPTGLVVALDRDGDLPDPSIGRNLLAIGAPKADALVGRLVICPTAS